MKLHHTTGKADWARISPARRNNWQRVAVSTHGLLTIGNVVSVVGLAMVCLGTYLLLTHDVRTGIWWILIGRICDVADGFVADHTGTKSPLGGAIDATFDKLGALAVLLAVAFGHVTPWWVAVLIALQNAANSVIAFVGWRRRLGVEPVLTGKLSTGLQWLSLASFMLAAGYAHVWLWPAYILLVPALLLGGVATAAYGRSVLKGRMRAAPQKNA